MRAWSNLTTLGATWPHLVQLDHHLVQLDHHLVTLFWIFINSEESIKCERGQKYEKVFKSMKKWSKVWKKEFQEYRPGLKLLEISCTSVLKCFQVAQITTWNALGTYLTALDTLQVLSSRPQGASSAIAFCWCYHLCMFANPLWIAPASSSKVGLSAIFSQVFCRNSRTGIAFQTVGSRDFEKDCCALAGSCDQ
jgi:hypothetical protein